MTTTQQDAQVERPYPELLSNDENKTLLKRAEDMWRDLQANNLGGFSGRNRPFWILHEFRRVIEEFGHRDTGLQWSKNQLEAAALSTASIPPQAVDTGVTRIRAEALEEAARVATTRSLMWLHKAGEDDLKSCAMSLHEEDEDIAIAIRALATTNP